VTDFGEDQSLDTLEYTRNHLMDTRLGISGVFHSMEFYECKDGEVVYFGQGWQHFAAEGETSNYWQRPDGCNDPNPLLRGFPQRGRPVIRVNTKYCSDRGIVQFGTWYGEFQYMLPTTGFALSPSYLTFEGNPNDMSTWVVVPNNNQTRTRRIEISIDPSFKPTGWFWATQFGEIVSGPEDVSCGRTIIIHGQSHVAVCLPQYISEDAYLITYKGNSNAEQRTYPGAGIVELPN
jgi:hypothetical protein